LGLRDKHSGTLGTVNDNPSTTVKVKIIRNQVKLTKFSGKTFCDISSPFRILGFCIYFQF
ncbi:MAG: hypothetical protein ACK56I_30320, partial [bacterium]